MSASHGLLNTQPPLKVVGIQENRFIEMICRRCLACKSRARISAFFPWICHFSCCQRALEPCWPLSEQCPQSTTAVHWEGVSQTNKLECYTETEHPAMWTFCFSLHHLQRERLGDRRLTLRRWVWHRGKLTTVWEARVCCLQNNLQGCLCLPSGLWPMCG